MNSTCNLYNKSGGRVVYNIKDPDCTVRREIYPGQVIKNMKVSELEKLIQQPGGFTLFYNYLMIDDEEILKYLLNGEEPAIEYWLTEDKIPTWINTCSVDEFKDALDNAPDGTKDLLKKYAVSVPLKDYEKRQAMIDQLGFDVTAAIELTKDESTPVAKAAVTTPSTTRRASTTSIVKPSVTKIEGATNK